jgi:hypothetical protein
MGGDIRFDRNRGSGLLREKWEREEKRNAKLSLLWGRSCSFDVRSG